MTPIAAALLTLCLASTATAAETEAAPGTYLGVVRQELARLSLTPRCDDARGECRLRMLAPRSLEQLFDVVIRVSPATATVHMSIDELWRLDPNEASSQAKLLMELLELSGQLVTAKLDWNRQSASIRLSTFVSTDSNFDRAAFRAQLLALVEAAAALRPRIEAAASPQGTGAP